MKFCNLLNHFDYIGDRMNEKELVRKAQSGDFDAFAKLVDANKERIYSLARKMTGNDQDAEDILQETLLRAIDKIDQFRGDASFGTWLYTITLNLARAQFAKKKQTDLQPLEDYLPGTFVNGGHHHEGSALFDWKDPHKLMESEQLRDIIDKSISELPYKYREAFVLRFVEELSVKEVARLIQQSEASTKSRIFRARLAMRDKLSKVFENEYGGKVS